MSALRKMTCFYITIYFIKRDLFSFKTCVLCVKITPPIKLQTEVTKARVQKTFQSPTSPTLLRSSFEVLSFRIADLNRF